MAQLLADSSAAQRGDLTFLAGVCQTAVMRYPASYGAPLAGTVSLGCACCPPFKGCAPEPAGNTMVKRADEGARVYPLRHRHSGSFSAVGKTEVAATFVGCESGAENRGGTLVLDSSTMPPKQVVYRGGVNADDCLVASRKGKPDLLLCEWSDGQGGSGYTRIVTFDLTMPLGLREVTTLLNDGTCMLNAGFVYVVTKLEKMRLQDMNGDGVADLVLDLMHQGGVVTDAMLEECRSGAEVPFNPPSMPTGQPHQWVYYATAAGYLPSPATKRLTNKLMKPRTDFRRKLEGS